jgi:hypothetical protein
MNPIETTRGPLRGMALLLGTAAVLSLAACAGTPPLEQVAVSRAAVERVSGANAAEAPIEVASARDKLARAQRAMADKDYGLARQLAAQAEADATLAEAKARVSRSDTALAEVRASIRALRAEMAGS